MVSVVLVVVYDDGLCLFRDCATDWLPPLDSLDRFVDVDAFAVFDVFACFLVLLARDELELLLVDDGKPSSSPRPPSPPSPPPSPPPPSDP